MKVQKTESYLKNLFLPVTRSSSFPYLLIVLFVLGFWFYWSQIRVIQIRRQCYLEVFTPTTQNAKWSVGKVWRVLYPSYDMAKGNRLEYGFWGWGYPPTDAESTSFKQCLIWKGATDTLLELY